MIQKIEEILVKILGKTFLVFLLLCNFIIAKDSIKIEKVENNDIEFKILSNKNEAYEGEPIVVTLRLKIKKSLPIVDYRFYPPKFNNFWVKEFNEEKTKKYLLDTPKYLVKELNYVIFPQKSGILKVDPAVINLAIPDKKEDLFGLTVAVPKWISVRSNPLEITIKPLPKEVDLVGSFKIKTYIDKKEIKPNEPVNFSVEIFGKGNIEDFEKIDLDILNATVFSDTPIKIQKFKDKNLSVKFIQKFSIVSNKNFTIPSLKIDYFNPIRNKIETLESKSIDIKVLNAQRSEKLSYKKPAEQNLNKLSFLFGAIVGILITILIVLIFYFFKKREKKIRFTNSDKELLNRVLPYISKDLELELFAKELYGNIYENKKYKIDKKRLNKILKRYESKNKITIKINL